MSPSKTSTYCKSNNIYRVGDRNVHNFTILVPYSMACSVWKVPFLPVIPWQMTRVFLSTKTAGGGGAVAKERDWEIEFEDDDDDDVRDVSFEERLAMNRVACRDILAATPNLSSAETLRRETTMIWENKHQQGHTLWEISFARVGSCRVDILNIHILLNLHQIYVFMIYFNYINSKNLKI